MNNLTRRKFISQLLVLLASLGGASSVVHARDKLLLDLSEQKGCNLLQGECSAVYDAWAREEKIEPVRYFVNAMEGYKLELWQISEAAELDFQQNIFFITNGLQLSKTEASFLALLSSPTDKNQSYLSTLL